MRLDKQAILSDKQAVRGLTGSTNAIDLSSSQGSSGAGSANTDSNAGKRIHGYSASATSDRSGRVVIEQKLGSKGQRFLGMITTTLSGDSVTGLTIEFVNHDSLTGTSIPTTGGTVVASVTLQELTAGTQIPWPNIPRYLTKRFFGLRYRPVKGAARNTAATNTAGNVTAGFVEDVPDHELV